MDGRSWCWCSPGWDGRVVVAVAGAVPTAKNDDGRPTMGVEITLQHLSTPVYCSNTHPGMLSGLPLRRRECENSRSAFFSRPAARAQTVTNEGTGNAAADLLFQLQRMMSMRGRCGVVVV